MKSKWDVTCNVIDGKRLYGVYRCLNVDEVDHSGNREMYGGFDYHFRDTAQDLAEFLNRREAMEAQKQAIGESKIRKISEIKDWLHKSYIVNENDEVQMCCQTCEKLFGVPIETVAWDEIRHRVIKCRICKGKMLLVPKDV